MAATPDLESGRKFLERLSLEVNRSAERPVYTLHVLACIVASVLFLLPASWASSVYFVPAVVLACRYHELAWYREVRVSYWLLTLITMCAMVSVWWTIEHHTGTFELALQLAMAVTVFGAGVHLWTTQRRFADRFDRRIDDDHRPRWAGGGFLAGMPALFVLGLYGGLVSWRTPIVLLWGLSAIPLLALQLRTHPMFPRLAIAWLLAFFGIDVICLAPNNETQGDDLFLAASILLVVLPLAGYLEFHPRVRRTFRAEPMPRTEEPAPITPVLRRDAKKRRETSVPA